MARSVAVPFIYESFYTVPCAANQPGAIDTPDGWVMLLPARYRSTVRSQARTAYLKEHYPYEKAEENGFFVRALPDKVFVHILGFTASRQEAMDENVRIKDHLRRVLDVVLPDKGRKGPPLPQPQHQNQSV